MVPRSRNARGFTAPLRPCGPSLRPSQGPDVRLRKIGTLRRGDWSVPQNLTQNQNRFTTASKHLRGPCVASTWNYNHGTSPLDGHIGGARKPVIALEGGLKGGVGYNLEAPAGASNAFTTPSFYSKTDYLNILTVTVMRVTSYPSTEISLYHGPEQWSYF